MLLAGVLPLLAVTDPPLLRYVTYVGFGSGTVSTAVDKVGSQYISGLTEVPWSPCGNEPVRELRRGMVTKLRPGGDGVVWTKCLAGVTAGVAVDGSGFVYVLSNFSDVATVTKLAAGDARVIYSRQIAGATATAIAVDRDGAAYVTGSAVAGLATTAGVYQGAFGPCLNNAPKCTAGFVAKIGVGGAVELATYTGIVGTTAAIGVDSQKSVWVAGTTSAGFGGIGWTRGFAVKFDSSLGKVLVGTGVKGGRTHQATIGSWISDMALDGKDAVYLTGGAPPFALNGTPGALQPVPPTGNMFGPFGFVWKLDSNGNTVYQTYLKTERGAGAVAVDGEGNAYVEAPQQRGAAGCNPSSSVMVLSADGSRIVNSIPLHVTVQVITLDGKGGVYGVGEAPIWEVPDVFRTTSGAFLREWPGAGSVAAVKVDLSQSAGPMVRCVVNAGSGAMGWGTRGVPDGSVAPGEIVTIFGTGLGAGVTVEFDGRPAPVLYADGGQVNAVVPFGLDAAKGATVLSVQGAPALQLPLAQAAPGLFTYGPARERVLNGDGTVNSRENPAERGGVVVVYLTGAGVYDQSIADGAMGPMAPPYPVPVIGVAARVGETLAEVLFAGQAPGMVAGLVQVNVRLPDVEPAKAQSLTIHLGNYRQTTSLVVK